MHANTFGSIFRLTTYGESHGTHIGGMIDGCPAGVQFTLEEIQNIVDKRKPSRSTHGIVSTARQEADKVHIIAGVLDNNGVLITLGTPIAFFVENEDIRSKDYSSTVYRPGHADYTYHKKFGIFTSSGGGRASARETVARVVGGAIAKQILSKYGISIYTGTEEFAGIKAKRISMEEAQENTLFAVDGMCIPHWISAIENARSEGDSLGGIVRVEVRGLPIGLGEPVFDKLDARLAYALLSIGAVKGFEIGSGFAGASKKGSEHNDPISADINGVSNNAGGILGGISTGHSLILRAAIKPISSIKKQQDTLNIKGEKTRITLQGRHDCSAIPRIIPIISAMVALTLIDFILLQKTRKMEIVSRETI